MPANGGAAKRGRGVRVAVLLGLLLGAAWLLAHRGAVQAWATGSAEGVRKLVGRPAPEIPAAVRGLDGQPVRLAALRGRVVLLHFWTFG